MSANKRQQTMAKIRREQAVRERRAAKQEKKEAARRAKAEGGTVDERTRVQLAGSATDADNDALTYLWRQVEGPGIKLTHGDRPDAEFIAPDVKQDTAVKLELVVSDGKATSEPSLPSGCLR